jgi:hypothetical protein
VTDDLRQRYAQALAEKFTSPTYRSRKIAPGEYEDIVENPEPADRIDRQMWVHFTASDGHPSTTGVTCEQAAEVCAAVRDEETTRLRDKAAEDMRYAAERVMHHAQRADQAEAHALRLRQAVTILRAALRHDTPCNGPSPDVDPCGACVAIEYLAGAAIDEPEIEGEPQETRNPGERPSERLPGPLHSPTGPRKDSLPEAALDEPEAHHE